MIRSPFRLILLGDIMIGRLVDQIFAKHVDNREEYEHACMLLKRACVQPPVSYSYIWGNTLDYFHPAYSDLRIGNLETSVTHSNIKWPQKAFNYRCAPENLQTLKEINLDYVCLANNHTLDYSQQGMNDTMNALNTYQIPFAGVGKNLSEARRPAILHRNNTTIGLFSFADHYSYWAAQPTMPGINYINVEQLTPNDRLQIKEYISDYQLKNKISLTIVSLHWGSNYQWSPPVAFQLFAHWLIDECHVDIIHGHSSHHVQGIEIYKGKPIIYGCGDFIDDYAIDKEYRNDLSFIYLIDMDMDERKVTKIELIPTRCTNMQVNELTRNDQDYEWLFSTLARLSAPFGINVQKINNNNHFIIQS
ncbi:unnamed protein product [Didymodactylos carnosus]|uniref:Capsule synthesis protein CapA domain-containing protein n=1 Tax=Didymodactylos carnosus TaxID=1234261 RepID=A0A813RCU2_9BILA|nr:unnamed protein product [Didymodactylos carnosus]CAF0807391.1 unnamed protein product [Didymodactylos carnosus]CAF3562163.1 unnamed protein product [Didymodactylos carnosus]CAF3591103.1 unnamed protein product [Didymodactylos carnosus]